MQGGSLRRVKHILRPDGFAIGLFLVGLLLVVAPIMAMPGIIATVSALAYWLIMAVIRGARGPTDLR